MRLIDADAFNEQEVLEKLRTAEFDDEIQDVIEKIPTAYDVDKVEEQIEEFAYSKVCEAYNRCPYKYNENVNCEICGAIRALEIVRYGGEKGIYDE